MDTQQRKKVVNNLFSSRIGRRITLIMVLLSGFVTLTTTLMQIYWNYQQEINEISQKHQEVETVHSELLVSSLWAYDLPLLQQHLELLVNLPKIQYLEVQSMQLTLQAGKAVESFSIFNTYPLIHFDVHDQEYQKIGTIYVESNAEEIYRALLWRFFNILLINALKTFLVCGVLLVIFHVSINRRIFKISQYLREYSPKSPSLPLSLEKKKWIIEKEDEIELLGNEANRITTNITNLYQNIRQEKERLADFTQVSSDWLWETNAQGDLTYCSDSMLKALNIAATETPKLQDISIFEKSNALIFHLKKKKSFNHCEVIIEKNQGNTYLMFQAIARYMGDIFIGFRGTALDISSLKNTQIELRNLNDNLEQKVALRTQDLELSILQLRATQTKLIEAEKLSALGGLVAGVAHEVNTPLGISVTAASIINETAATLNEAFSKQTLTSTEFTELMYKMTSSGEMLENNLNRAAKLIRDFKQTAVDQVSESRCQFDVVQTLEALLSSLRSETRKVPVVPEIISVAGSVKINSLPGVLSQIMTNLILNSVNHAFENAVDAKIAIYLIDRDDDLIIEYIDNGSGVEPELHQKIFEPFYTSKRGHGGSGLGLNLVFNLVNKKLHGDLMFESEIGHGVKFTLTIPKILSLKLGEAT